MSHISVSLGYRLALSDISTIEALAGTVPITVKWYNSYRFNKFHCLSPVIQKWFGLKTSINIVNFNAMYIPYLCITYAYPANLQKERFSVSLPRRIMLFHISDASMQVIDIDYGAGFHFLFKSCVYLFNHPGNKRYLPSGICLCFVMEGIPEHGFIVCSSKTVF